MPEAQAITSISTFHNHKSGTILILFAAPKLSLQLQILPRKASVLEAPVVSTILPADIVTVSINHTHRELADLLVSIQVFSTADQTISQSKKNQKEYLIDSNTKTPLHFHYMKVQHIL